MNKVKEEQLCILHCMALDDIHSLHLAEQFLIYIIAERFLYSYHMHDMDIDALMHAALCAQVLIVYYSYI